MDISVIVPSLNDGPGLYFTYAAAFADLETGTRSFEIVPVIDGDESAEARGLAMHGARLVRGRFGSPQASRYAGLLASHGRWVFFLDSHVIPSRGFFERMVKTAEETDATLVFSPHVDWSRDRMAYAHRIGWQDSLWCVDAETKPRVETAYRAAQSGHGGILVDREKYLASGGYWLAQRGWGGEETHLSLKLWMLGYECWMEPRVYHWHYMGGRRNDGAFQSRDYVRNFMLAAYALGGQKYLDAVYTYHTANRNCHSSVAAAARAKHDDPYGADYRNVPRDAAAERERICAGSFGGDLDNLREHFRAQGITH